MTQSGFSPAGVGRKPRANRGVLYGINHLPGFNPLVGLIEIIKQRLKKN
jgi:hypothetical protein